MIATEPLSPLATDVAGADRLTARQQRERAYYEEFSRRCQPKTVSFDPVAGREQRPWNSYWYLYGRVRALFTSPGQRLLDFGCGNGVPSLRFAYVGFDVCGFDNCPNHVAVARELARESGLQNRTHFTTQVAERLDYRDESFDVVAGIDILHHVEIEPAMREVRRMLKPGGVALFREPIHVPLWDRLRNTRLGKWLAPNDRSFDLHITDDERKLDAGDLAAISKLFPSLTLRRFVLCSRFNRFLAHPGLLQASTLEHLDQRLFRTLPLTRRWGGAAVLEMRKR